MKPFTVLLVLLVGLMAVMICLIASGRQISPSTPQEPSATVATVVASTPTARPTEHAPRLFAFAATPTAVFDVLHPAISAQNCAMSNGPLPELVAWEMSDSVRPVNSSLGGGVVKSEKFTIEILLYCDPAFMSTSTDGMMVADINGLAIYYNWRYEDSFLSGEINTYYGIWPEVLLHRREGPGGVDGGYVSQGENIGVRFGFDTYPDLSQAGFYQFVFVLQSGLGDLSGALLGFDLVPAADGVGVEGIEVTPLNKEELDLVKGILPPVWR